MCAIIGALTHTKIVQTITEAPRYTHTSFFMTNSPKNHEYIGPDFSPESPKYYVIDKALNYGNSGGSIILKETGKAISVCIKFQPVDIQQDYNSHVTIPSLYNVSSPLKNIETELKTHFEDS